MSEVVWTYSTDFFDRADTGKIPPMRFAVLELSHSLRDRDGEFHHGIALAWTRPHRGPGIYVYALAFSGPRWTAKLTVLRYRAVRDGTERFDHVASTGWEISEQWLLKKWIRAWLQNNPVALVVAGFNHGRTD